MLLLPLLAPEPEEDWLEERVSRLDDDDVMLLLVALALWWVWLPAATGASLSLDVSVLVTSKSECMERETGTQRERVVGERERENNQTKELPRQGSKLKCCVTRGALPTLNSSHSHYQRCDFLYNQFVGK